MKRLLLPFILLAPPLLGGASSIAFAQGPKEFNACAVFTEEDAGKVLGAAAEAEAAKGKPPKNPPKFVPTCTYNAVVEGKPQFASVNFRFARTPAEAAASFKETRLEVRGKPVIINGHDAFWHPKMALLHMVKGATWVVIAAGPPKENERQPEQARKLAEILIPKI
jgi:hypothetical protein